MTELQVRIQAKQPRRNWMMGSGIAVAMGFYTREAAFGVTRKGGSSIGRLRCEAFGGNDAQEFGDAEGQDLGADSGNLPYYILMLIA